MPLVEIIRGAKTSDKTINAVVDYALKLGKSPIVVNVFGWPMGPAYLLDVVGIDTAFHCTGVMADGFP